MLAHLLYFLFTCLGTSRKLRYHYRAVQVSARWARKATLRCIITSALVRPRLTRQPTSFCASLALHPRLVSPAPRALSQDILAPFELTTARFTRDIDHPASPCAASIPSRSIDSDLSLDRLAIPFSKPYPYPPRAANARARAHLVLPPRRVATSQPPPLLASPSPSPPRCSDTTSARPRPSSEPGPCECECARTISRWHPQAKDRRRGRAGCVMSAPARLCTISHRPPGPRSVVRR